MKEIKILDCTLRDGGYVNNWNFGYSTINAIIGNLSQAGIDTIECGFLSETKETDSDKSVYRTLAELNERFAGVNSRLACMVNYGEYAIEDLPEFWKDDKVQTLRVAFHRKDLQAALAYCAEVKKKGYEVFVQPMVTQAYSTEELDYLLAKTNEIGGAAVYVVDSFGTMRQEDAVRLFEYYDARLDKGIQIGFHSHNNLQLSFSSAQELIKVDTDRVLVLDSSVFGMGRGAGNLCTELLTMHLNEKCGARYNLIPILEIIDNWLSPIFNASPWGYSVPYYIAAINNCHPNYATWLVNKATLGVKAINEIISQLPEENKKNYKPRVIEELYQNYQSHSEEDTSSIKGLKEYIADRVVLLLAPGRMLKERLEDVQKFILKHNVCVIAVNFDPEEVCADMLFVSNMKRFSSLQGLTTKKQIVTSNIQGGENAQWRVDYASLTDNHYEEIDNAGMMVLRLMRRLGVKHVALAGFDGYSTNQQQNYVSEKMILNTSAEVLEQRNAAIIQQIEGMREDLEIEFVTPSIYEKK